MNAGKQVPEADFGDLGQLSTRFSINGGGEPEPAPPPGKTPRHTSHTDHTSTTDHTPHTGKTSASANPEKTRRTYYFSTEVADNLAAAVAELHYASHGRVTKASALDAIIAAGIAQLKQVKTDVGLTNT